MLGLRQRLILSLLLILLIFYPTTIFLRQLEQEQKTVNYWSKNPHNIHSHPFSDTSSSSHYTAVRPYARSILDWPRLRDRNNTTNSTADNATPSNGTHSNSTGPIEPEPTDTSPLDSIDCRGDFTSMSFLLRLICDGGMQHYALLMTYIAIGAVVLGIVALCSIYLSICLRGNIQCTCEQEEMEKKRKKRMLTGGGPLEELLIGIEEREGLENTDGAMATIALPSIKKIRPKRNLYPRWVQGELNAKNTVPAEELKTTSAPVSSKQEALERREKSVLRGLCAVRNPFMPSVSELVAQTSPRVVSTGHDIRLGGGGLKMKPRITGWGFAAQ